MEQQVMAQTVAIERSAATQKKVEEKSIGFYQLLAELTLQQKRQRAVVRT